MKRKALKIYGMAAVFILAFGGCGDGIDESGDLAVVPSGTTASAETRELSPIEEYERRKGSGEFAAEDYEALAALYREEGLIRKQRDLLEQGYRLYGGERFLDSLQEITVNLKEETDTIQAEAQRLYNNIAAPEYLNEAAAMLYSEDWMNTMMPKLKEGLRRYYMEGEEGTIGMSFEAGYDSKGVPYSSVWYTGEDGQMQYLTRRGNSLQLLTTGMNEGKYQGGFESWLCIAGTGDVYYEKGTFEKNVIVGEYTAGVRYGGEATDLFALWSSRTDVDMTEYKGDFGSEGFTTVEQPEGAKRIIKNGGNGEEHFVVYAYTSDKKDYLFMNAAEGTEPAAMVFDCSLLGVDPYPSVTAYEPKPVADGTGETEEAAADGREVQIRIYDNNIEWFDGTQWRIAGSVDKYEKEDPFLPYSQEQAASQEGDSQTPAVEEEYDRRGAGTVQSAPPAGNPKPNDNKKPTKPTTPTTPVTPPATEQPVTPPTGNGGGSSGGSSGGGDSGGGNSGGGDSGGGNQNPGDSGGGNTGGNGGGDVDIGWSDDIM